MQSQIREYYKSLLISLQPSHPEYKSNLERWKCADHSRERTKQVILKIHSKLKEEDKDAWAEMLNIIAGELTLSGTRMFDDFKALSPFKDCAFTSLPYTATQSMYPHGEVAAIATRLREIDGNIWTHISESGNRLFIAVPKAPESGLLT